MVSAPTRDRDPGQAAPPRVLRPDRQTWQPYCGVSFNSLELALVSSVMEDSPPSVST